MGDLFKELRRRNVFRVAALYAVVGWATIQIVVAVAGPLSLPVWTASFFIVLFLAGLPLALIFAWAFEVTPDGVKRTAAVSEGEPVTAKTGKTLDYAILGGLALVAILIISDRLMPSFATADSQPPLDEEENVLHPEEDGASAASVTKNAAIDKSIAVLPFANRSPDPNDAFFAAGMHDDLLTLLSKIADMRVISRTSVMGYADTERRIPEIAAELGVATIMEGGVQRAGNRVRINVQLIDAATDAHLWAEIYDRELTAENVFDIQSEITRAIADALNAVLSGSDEAALAALPTQNLAAYDAYLHGNALFDGVSNRDEYDAVLAAYNEAIEADPNFAAAYAAKVEAQLSVYWNEDIGNRDWVTAARETLDKAQALAPDGVETLVATGYYYYYGFFDYDRAGEYIDRALVKAPNDAGVWGLKGFVARRAGRFSEAIRALEKALELDPLSTELFSNLTQSYVGFGEFEKTRAEIERFRALAPNSIWLLRTEIAFWEAQGMPERVLDAIEAAAPPPEWDEFQINRLFVAALMGDHDSFDQALQNLPSFLRDDPNFSESYDSVKASGLYVIGRKDEAQNVFEEIRVRLAALEDPYPGGWGSNVSITPIALPGYLGDLDGVRAAEADYKANAPEDAWSQLDRYAQFAAAFAMAGDPDTAFDYLDKRARVAGPSHYLRVRNDPHFDNLRDHPRYAKLKADFDAWAEETGYAQ